MQISRLDVITVEMARRPQVEMWEQKLSCAMGEQEITGLDFYWQKLKADILVLLHCSTKLSFLGKGEKCSLWLASIF